MRASREAKNRAGGVKAVRAVLEYLEWIRWRWTGEGGGGGRAAGNDGRAWGGSGHEPFDRVDARDVVVDLDGSEARARGREHRHRRHPLDVKRRGGVAHGLIHGAAGGRVQSGARGVVELTLITVYRTPYFVSLCSGHIYRKLVKS